MWLLLEGKTFYNVVEMPLVHIRYKSTVSVDTLKNIIPIVNDTVAVQLCCDDKPEKFKVLPSMVKIRFSKSVPLDSQMPDLFIEVEGRAFASRLGKQEVFAAEIGKAVEPLLPGKVTYGVWVKLQQAGWHAGSGKS